MRIFVIGNGPSLAHTPLDLLQGEDTFACNKISLIYDKVKWRPTYYWHVDFAVHDSDWKQPMMDSLAVAKHSWVLEDFRKGLPVGHPNHDDLPPELAIGEQPNVTWLPRCKKHAYLSVGHPKSMKAWHFPEICTAYNSISGMIQLSVQMGYDEIYLLGCDLNYQLDYSKNHFDPKYTESYAPKTGRAITDLALTAFWVNSDNANALHAHEIARRECEARGVKLFNATMGGILDTHPRVKLMDILESSPLYNGEGENNGEARGI